MGEKQIPDDAVLVILEGNPQRIAEFTAGLDETGLHTPPAENEWSVVEVLAHIRSTCDVWGKAIQDILENDRRSFKAVNPRTWIDRTDYPLLDFSPSFEGYLKQRAELLMILRGLKPSDWLRETVVTGAGKPLVRSVHFYAQWLATHERTHVKQIQKTVEAVAKILGGYGSAPVNW